MPIMSLSCKYSLEVVRNLLSTFVQCHELRTINRSITGKHITFSRWPVSLQPFDWSLEGTLSIRCWQPVKYYQSFHIVTESAQNKSTNTKTNFIIKISNVLNSSSGLTEYHFYVSIISAYSYVSVFRVWHCSLSLLTGLP